MAMPVNDILEDVQSLKGSASANSTFGDYDEALADLERAIQSLLSELEDIERQELISTESKENRRHKLARQLADSYGMVGGVYRRKAKKDKSNLDMSILMYDKGCELENDKSYNIQNSYNLTNSIVVRVLKDPRNLTTQEARIRDAIETIQKQVEVKRRGEWWAWADLGQLYLLSGKSKEALQSYEKFKSTGAPSKDYESAIDVLAELEQVLATTNSHISEAISEVIQFLKNNKPDR